MVLFVTLLALVALPASQASPPVLAPLNGLVGDAGFIARHGRLPTATDTQVERIRAHLAWVGAELAREPPPLEAAVLAEREASLRALADYAERGAFPKNHDVPGRAPVFIDEHGNVCAVGHLIATSAGRDEAERIAASWRYTFIARIDDPAIATWAADHGFSRAELAMIQPTYDWEPRPPRPPKPPRPEPPEPPERIEPTPPSVPGVPDLALLAPGAIANTQAAGTWIDPRGFTHHVFARADGGERHLFLVRMDRDGRVVGSGTITGRRMTWRAWYPSGKLLAIGNYLDDQPNGRWTIYGPEGRVMTRPLWRRGELVRVGLQSQLPIRTKGAQ